VDVQVVAATNKNLEDAVKQGRFREDLYYRLKTIEIRMPPLREHPGDIGELAEFLLDMHRKAGRTRCRLSDSALRMLEQYDWPGNVRELRNAIEHAVMFANRQGHAEVETTDLPSDTRNGSSRPGGPALAALPESGIDVAEDLARLELAYIEEALKKSGGKKTEAWKLLGYNDRFALRRRAQAIMRSNPRLLDEFPNVRREYGGK
jgi:transcriptional regulator with PAS, ATPase and Fis domain